MSQSREEQKSQHTQKVSQTQISRITSNDEFFSSSHSSCLRIDSYHTRILTVSNENFLAVQ